MKHFRYIIAWCLLAALASPTLAANSTHIHHIKKMERLDVIVIGRDDLTTEVRVDSKGYIDLPLVGRIGARGKTIEALQIDIVRALRVALVKDPMVLVDVLFDRQFTIRGQVNRPGVFFYTPGMTIEMAVAIAGGFTSLANSETVLMTRFTDQDAPPIEVKLSTRVRPGDSIEIEQRLY